MDFLKVFLIIFISSQFLFCKGQVKSENIRTKKKSVTAGKSVSKLDNQIWSIFQDKKRNYWFGSDRNGVYYFDGETLLQFTTNDGLASNTIRGIQEDEKGNIYIESPDGVSKYDGTKFSILNIIESPDNEWKLETTDLWFGYNAKDVYRYDGKSLFKLKLPRKDLKKAFGLNSIDDPSDRINYPYAVYGVNKDSNGNIWFGTYTAGAFRFDGKSFLWFDEKELSELPDGRVTGVRSIIQDKDGYFWLSNFYSKYRINPNVKKGYEKTKAFDTLQENKSKDSLLYFNSGIVDTVGNLWMTTFTNGVWKYDGKILAFIQLDSTMENIKVISIYQDSNGTLWLATKDNGIYKYNGDRFAKFELDLLLFNR